MSNGKQSYNKIKFRHAIAASFLLGIQLTSTDALANWRDDATIAISDLKQNRCGKAWNTLWKWARKDHKDANAMIAGALLSYGLYPPNLPDAVKQWKSTFLFFRLNAHRSEDGSSDDISLLILNGSEVRQPQGRLVAQCIIEKQKNNCRDLAIRYHVILAYPNSQKLLNAQTRKKPIAGLVAKIK